MASRRWQDQGAFLGELEAAGKQLVQSCQAVRHDGQCSSSQTVDGSSEQQHELELEQALSALQQLLGNLPQVAGRRRESRLLQLPDDLLIKLVHSGGKELRLVCTRLRDAYGCPGTTLKEPPVHYSFQSLARQCAGFTSTAQELQQALAQQDSYEHPAVQLDVLQRWPAQWAGHLAQVTHLELSDARRPDIETVVQIHSLLPGLRELKCAWMKGDRHYARRCEQLNRLRDLPRFTALTALTALCSTEDVAASSIPRRPVAAFHFLHAMPGLRSLRADLRFCVLGKDCLPNALRSLPQLTHLELAFGPMARLTRDATQQVDAALEAVEEQLQSLVLLSPAWWVWAEEGLGDLLAHLPRLTSLEWSLQGMPAHAGADVHGWALAPNLKRLVLSAGDHCFDWTIDAASSIWEAFNSKDMSSIETLELPAFDFNSRNGSQPGAEECFGTLAMMVRDIPFCFPNLTSLRLGMYCHDAHDGEGLGLMPTEVRYWLLGVTSMDKLQRLQLWIDAEEMYELQSIPGAPRLTALHLHLRGGGTLQEERPLELPGIVLGRLHFLREVEVSLEPGVGYQSCELLAADIVDAIKGMTHLEVLRIDSMAQACESRASWLALRGSLPACLQKVLQ